MQETLQLALRFLSLYPPAFLSFSQLAGTPCIRRTKPITGQLTNGLADHAGDLSEDSRCLFPIHHILHLELQENFTALIMLSESLIPSISRAQALARLALRYIETFGTATQPSLSKC